MSVSHASSLVKNVVNDLVRSDILRFSPDYEPKSPMYKVRLSIPKPRNLTHLCRWEMVPSVHQMEGVMSDGKCHLHALFQRKINQLLWVEGEKLFSRFYDSHKKKKKLDSIITQNETILIAPVLVLMVESVGH